MADTPSLVVQLSAQLDRFERDLNRAGDLVDRSIGDMERKFNSFNPSLSGLLNNSVLTKVIGGLSFGALVDHMKQAVDQAAKLGEQAQKLGVSTDFLQTLQIQAKGVGSDIESAALALQKFNQNVSEAARGQGDLLPILRANGVALRDSSGQLRGTEDLYRAYIDLIKNAKNQQDATNLSVIAFGKAAGPDLLNALRQGHEGINKTGQDAVALGQILDREFIQKAQEIQKQWDQTGLVISTRLKGMFIDAAGEIQEFVSRLKDLFNNSIGTPTPESLIRGIANLRREIDLLTREAGRANPAFAAVIEGNIESLQKDLDDLIAKYRSLTGKNPPTPITVPVGTPAGSTGNGSTIVPDAENAVDKSIRVIQKRQAALEAESATIAQSVYQQELYRTQLELEAVAKSNDIPITDALRARIDEVAASYARAAQATALAKQQFQQQQELLRFAGDQLITFLNSADTWSGKATQSLQKLGLAIFQAAQQALLLGSGPLAGLFGTASTTPGAVGGILGQLFGAGKTAAAGVTDPWEGIVPGRAEGGSVEAGKPYLVGEKRPEIFVPSASGMIIPQIAGGAGTQVNINNYSGEQTQVNRSKGPDGREMIDVVIGEWKKRASRGEFKTVGVGTPQTRR